MAKPKRKTNPARRKSRDINQPVTIRDFHELADFIGDTVATKEDLGAFATKEEVREIVSEELTAYSKRALNVFATKDDLQAFATKDELTTFKDDILTSNDKLGKKLDTLLAETAAIGGRLDRSDRHPLKN